MTITLDIPPLPVASAHAWGLIRHPDPTVDDLARIVNGDAGFTSAVLRAANSAASAPIEPVSTGRDAIVRLGVSEGRRIVLAVTLNTTFRGLAGSGIDEGELWRHLIATATIADMLAAGETHQHEAFTAGLLHDVGRLAMAARDPRRYGEVVALLSDEVTLIEAEERVFGHSHLEWGESIGWNWGFPAGLTAAIGDHHRGRASELAQTVAEARRLAYGMGIGNGIVPPPDPDPGADARVVPALLALGGVGLVADRIGWFEGALRRVA